MNPREENRSAGLAGRVQHGATAFKGTGLHPGTPLGVKLRRVAGASGATMPNGDPPALMLWGEEDGSR